MIKKTILGFLAICSFGVQLAIAAPAVSEGSYTVDSAHSSVAFEVPYLVISSVDGHFSNYASTFNVSKKGDFSVNAEIDVVSIDTANKKRDDHLRSADFFDVDKYPNITFVGKKTSWKSNKDFILTGDLTMHGITKEIALNGKYLGQVVDAQGRHRVAFDVKGSLNRRDFGIDQNMVVEAGQVVGDIITLRLKVQATKN